MKNWTVEKKDEIERILINLWASIPMDIPSNFEDIVQFVYEDVCETADEENWSDGDVVIGFRRWIESNTEELPKKYYYMVLHTNDGERWYDHRSVHQVDDNIDINKYGHEFCKTFWNKDGGEEIDEDEFQFGDIVCSLHDCKEIPYEQFIVLGKYLPVHVG